ncbi:MAG TPA: hypothetical protein VF883_00455 [Thermoanaerobaculia bacterium]|jgi:hypothetical protein
MRRTPFLLLVSLLLSLSASAVESGMWGQRGASRRFVVSANGSYLYAADGRGVAVYDVRAANTIARIDVEWSDAETYDLALMGNDLVVATSEGLERFSIAGNGTIARLGFTDATGPTPRVAASARYAATGSGRTLTVLEREENSLGVVRRIPMSADITAIAFIGEHLYVALDREPLRVFLPPSSTPVAVLPGVNAEAFAASGGMLWTVSFDDGLTGLDVSNPANPKSVASAGRGVLRLRGVAAAGPRVYAFEYPNQLHVFDVSTPAEPRLLITMTEWVNVVAAHGSRMFLAGSIAGDRGILEFDPGLIPRETGKPVRVFDGLSLAAEYSDLAGPVSGVWTDGSVAYVVDPPYLRVLDVSKTSEPREVLALEIENLQDKIRVKNGKAIIWGRAYVNYLDVSTPLRPRFLSTWDAQGHPPSGAAILRDRVIEANDHSGMHIVDFSDPARGVQIGGRKWHYHDVAAGEDAAYALMRDLMLVVEIAGETTVVDRGLVHIQYEQVDTVPPNSLAPHSLLVRGDEGLRLYDIAGENRFAPQEIGFVSLPGAGVFGTNDGSAYVEKDGRLHFLDLPNMTPQETDMRVTAPMQISVAGEKVVVADRYSVRVYGPDTAPPPPLPTKPTKRRSSRH